MPPQRKFNSSSDTVIETENFPWEQKSEMSFIELEVDEGTEFIASP